MPSSSHSHSTALQVADFLGTDHYNCTFTVEEGLDALEDLVWHLESYEQVSLCVVLLYPLRLFCRKLASPATTHK